MNACERTDSQDLERFAHGELGDREAAEMKKHVEMCKACNARVQEWLVLQRETDAVSEHRDALHLWPMVAARIATTPQDSVPAPGTPRRTFAYAAGVLLAASIVAIVVLKPAGPGATRASTASPVADLLDTAGVLAEPGVRTLELAIAEAEKASAENPGDAFVKGFLERARDDKAELSAQVSALTEAVR